MVSEFSNDLMVIYAKNFVLTAPSEVQQPTPEVEAEVHLAKDFAVRGQRADDWRTRAVANMGVV